MKGDITLKILETIEEFAIGAADLFAAILSAGYGASSSKIQFELSKIQREHDRIAAREDLERQAKQRYRNLIYKLKMAGLIKEDIKKDKKFFILTLKGKEKLSKLKNERLPEIAYVKEAGTKFVIVIFDIPEKEKKKRDWLRAVLKQLGLKMLQKSVFVGKIKIPKEFLDDLLKLRLLDYVEIFEISKTGSLKEII